MELAKLSIEVLKLFVALVGFYYLYTQVKLLTKNLGFVKRNIESNANAKLYDQYLKIGELFMKDAALRPYFYEGKQVSRGDPDPNDPHLEAKVATMCEAIAGVLEHAALQASNLPDDELSNCWKTYTQERLERSPELKQFLVDNERWYAPAFHKVVAEMKVALPPRSGPIPISG